MTHGIIIKNANRETQIDGNYKNLGLYESGSNITISNDGTDSGYNTLVSFSVATPLIPLILVQPNTDYHIIYDSYIKSGANYSGFYLSTKNNQSTVINWKCYTGHPVASSENYGLRIKNPQGDLVFDSGKNYFKIHSVHSFSLPGQSDTYTITHNDLENPYYLLTPSGIWNTILVPGPPTWIHAVYRVGIIKINSTSAQAAWVGQLSYSVGGPGGTGSWIPTHTVLVCDVI